jgi:hypothetical protein
MTITDGNPDQEHDRRVDLQETRSGRYTPRGILWDYSPPPRRRLRYWLRTIWKLIVPGGPHDG